VVGTTRGQWRIKTVRRPLFILLNTIMTDSSALLSHILSQTRQNIELLMAHNQIPRYIGQDMLTKLPTASDAAVRDLSEQTRRMTIPSPPLPPPSINYSPPPGPPSGPPARRIVPPPQPRIQRAKALWAYNENASVSLSYQILSPH
jgi:LAS seventeen-binding protein 1/2